MSGVQGKTTTVYAADIDDDGYVTASLEAKIRSGPKFIYALPNFQNPSGITMSLERRKLLIELADHYGVPILEDDPYGQLRYEGDRAQEDRLVFAVSRRANTTNRN